MIRYMTIFLLFFLNTQVLAIQPSSAMTAPVPGSKRFLSEKYFDILSEIHPAWVHTITAMNYKERIVTLDDGSEWKMSYWFSGNPKSWEIGDQVTISWHGDSTYFLDIKLKNHTKKDYGWATIKETPQVNNSGFLYIEHLQNRMSLQLNNGVNVTSKKNWMFNNFREGDVVITLYNKESTFESSYALWDVNSHLIAEDLILNSQTSSQ